MDELKKSEWKWKWKFISTFRNINNRYFARTYEYIHHIIILCTWKCIINCSNDGYAVVLKLDHRIYSWAVYINPRAITSRYTVKYRNKGFFPLPFPSTPGEGKLLYCPDGSRHTRHAVYDTQFFVHPEPRLCYTI